MSNEITVQQDKLIAKCVEVASTVLGENDAILEIRRGQPEFGRNYTVFYKVHLATLDGTGTNPTNKRCVVVAIPVSNIDSGELRPSINCDSVKDLD
ncbi:hypothetical protein SD80_015525 [Scytonema tolypothrichoides VB-61278]|nr:hypothetical protein SD80_015525 [Scytonema tolypothrichoides VB-61278]